MTEEKPGADIPEMRYVKNVPLRITMFILIFMFGALLAYKPEALFGSYTSWLKENLVMGILFRMFLGGGFALMIRTLFLRIDEKSGG